MIICSLNYSPGLRKEIALLGALIGQYENSETLYYTSKKYQLPKQSSLIRLLVSKEVIFYNSSLRHFPILLLRYCMGKSNVAVLHEPYKFHKLKYNLKAAFIVSVKEVLVRLMSYYAHELIVLSPYGLRIARRKFPHKISALSLYRKRNISNLISKKKVLFVGHINSTKVPDEFMKLSQLDGLTDYEFEIVTSSRCDGLTIPQNVQIFFDRNLSDAVISKKLHESAFVVIEHPNITQSGVFADAISHNCIVIYFGQDGIAQYHEDGVMLNIKNIEINSVPLLLAHAYQNRDQTEEIFEQLYLKYFSSEAFERDWKIRCQHVT